MNFDAHSDIWTDVTQHHLKGERDIFRKYHYERLKKGRSKEASSSYGMILPMTRTR